MHLRASAASASRKPRRWLRRGRELGQQAKICDHCPLLAPCVGIVLGNFSVFYPLLSSCIVTYIGHVAELVYAYVSEAYGVTHGSSTLPAPTTNRLKNRLFGLNALLSLYAKYPLYVDNCGYKGDKSLTRLLESFAK